MTFYICNLGCKVNAYEAKVMNDLFINAGYKQGSIDYADIYVINTCFVTNVAEHKSLQMIRKFRNKKPKMLIVAGCLSQIKPESLKDIGADIIIGNKDKSKIVEYIKNYHCKIVKTYDLNDVEFEDMRLNNYDKTRAFVKIQDGCNNFCSYCIIPYTRGNLRNKAKEVVLEEIRCLVKNNHKEIVLTGIHTGSYCDNNYDLADLINDIIKIKGLKRLRISSIEITEINDRIKNIIKDNNILVDHMHIPLQSGSNEILKLMNRKYNVDYFMKQINDLRKIRPNINITTDVIVGFPNETEALFNKTMETIKKINFSKLHVFPYSKREGTKASLMSEQINEKVKKERVRKLLQLSKEIEIDYMNNFINKKIEFIPEVYKNGYLIGHTGNYLNIKTKGDKTLLNKIVEVKIKEISYPYCLSSICKDIVDNNM